MTFGSVCSGIEAASVAWHALGFKAAWFSEIEKFPSAVLKHHYPEVPNLGDMTRLHEKEIYRKSAIDILVGGTPCQSFSVADLRGGLGDARGNLALTFCAIAHDRRPRWVVWENVPGVLSDEGNAFGCFLAGLSGASSQLRPGVNGWESAGVVSGPVYGLAWRVLNAQYFGVPQRRQRVFVVGCLGDWRRAAQVLFEPESLRGDSPPSRKAGQGITGTISSRPSAGGGLGTDFDLAGGLQVAHTLKGEGFGGPEDGTGRGTPIIAIQERAVSENPNAGPQGKGYQEGIGFTLESRQTPQAVVTDMRGNGDGQISPTLTKEAAGDRPSDYAPMIFEPRHFTRGQPGGKPHQGPVGALSAQFYGSSDKAPHLLNRMAVRRITPQEAERLQGFPDDYTLIPWRGGVSSDGPRYKAIGNSIAVPVMRWIGERIKLIEAALRP